MGRGTPASTGSHFVKDCIRLGIRPNDTDQDRLSVNFDDLLRRPVDLNSGT